MNRVGDYSLLLCGKDRESIKEDKTLTIFGTDGENRVNHVPPQLDLRDLVAVLE